MWVVYVADQNVNEVKELFSVPLDGSASARQLSTGTSATLFRQIRFATGSSRVVYLSDENLAQTFTLQSVPTDGSAAPVQLNGTLPSGRDVDSFALSPDGLTAVYLSNEQTSTSSRDELFSVPCDGSAAPVRLNTANVHAYSFQITSDGARVLYLQSNGSGGSNLFSVPIDGSAASVQLNSTLVSGGSVQSFALTPDGSGVVYYADQTVNNRFELYRVPSAGGVAPVSLTPTIPAFSSFSSYEISSSGTEVLFVADALTDNVIELFGVPFDGSSAAVRLNQVMTTGGRVLSAHFTPDATRIVYLASALTINVLELFSVPVDQSSAPVRLNDPLSATGDVSTYQLVGSLALYYADQNVDDTFELFAAAVDGSLPPVRLSAPFVSGGSAYPYFWPTPAEDRVLYLADQVTDEVFELWSAPIDGSAAPVRVNGPLVGNGDVRESVLISPDGQRVVYLADEDVDESVEVWNAPTLGGQAPLRLNGTLSAPPIVGDVTSFGWSPEGRDAVYLADEDMDNLIELYSVALEPNPVRTKWNTPLEEPPQGDQDFISPINGKPCMFVPGSSEILYARTTIQGSSSYSYAVYRADRSGSPTPASFLPSAPLLAGDRGLYYVVFSPEYNKIYGRALDGSDSPVQLNPNSVGVCGLLAVTPDNAHAVFKFGVYNFNGEDALWSAPTDGSTPALQLTGTGNPQRGTLALRIHPSGERVIYVGDDELNDVYELWSVPIDASAAPVRIGPALSGNLDVSADFLLSADGSRIVFRADATTDEVFELYAVSSNGGPVVKLSGPMVAGGDVPSAVGEPQFALSPDGAWVVYRADQDVDEVYELYAAPTDGSQPAVKLNEALSGSQDVPVHGFRITPDSAQVVFAADQVVPGQVELWVAPIDGSQAALRINPAMVSGGSLPLPAPYYARDSFALAVGGRHVYYLADQDTDGVLELYRAPTDGSGVAEKCNGTLVAGGNVTGFDVGPSGNRVLYRADEETNDVFELYLTEFPGSPGTKQQSGSPGRSVQRPSH